MKNGQKEKQEAFLPAHPLLNLLWALVLETAPCHLLQHLQTADQHHHPSAARAGQLLPLMQLQTSLSFPEELAAELASVCHVCLLTFTFRKRVECWFFFFFCLCFCFIGICSCLRSIWLTKCFANKLYMGITLFAAEMQSNNFYCGISRDRCGSAQHDFKDSADWRWDYYHI